jgi:glutamine synthetase
MSNNLIVQIRCPDAVDPIFDTSFLTVGKSFCTTFPFYHWVTIIYYPLSSSIGIMYRLTSRIQQTSRFISSSAASALGKQVFKGTVAKPFLESRGLKGNVLETTAWVHDSAMADKVAGAVLDWARSHDASVYCHWFQPLGSTSVRHGQSSQVQNRMFEFDREGHIVWEFKGKHLLQGETDGSSHFNGGMRATHRAGGYLTIDPTSSIFLRDDTVFIPACLISYHGYALDEKTPLHRSCDALSTHGANLLNRLGFKVDSLVCNVGLEQEFFLMPRDEYKKRVDLQLAGRTIMGRDAPRGSSYKLLFIFSPSSSPLIFSNIGQEMCDHYMAPPNVTGAPMACMKEIQEECYKLGIPLKTRHREVAPGQYEFAPTFGPVTSQIDQNLMVMQISTYFLGVLQHRLVLLLLF